MGVIPLLQWEVTSIKSLKWKQKNVYEYHFNIPVMPNELHFMSSMAGFNAIDTNGIALSCVACLASIEVMHWERCIAGDLV